MMQILYQLFAINLKHLLTLRLPRVSSVIHLRFRNHSKLSSFLLHEITSRIHCPQMLPPEPVLVSAVGTVFVLHSFFPFFSFFLPLHIFFYLLFLPLLLLLLFSFLILFSVGMFFFYFFILLFCFGISSP